MSEEFSEIRNIASGKGNVEIIRHDAIKPVGNENNKHTIFVSNNRRTKTRTPESKIRRRIEREIKKCTYIGDISVSEEEYVILKGLFQNGYRYLCASSGHELIDPVFAVALVQVGIRFYDGKFWPHVKNELCIGQLPNHQQAWIGRSFYKTLIKFGKYHVAPNEYVKNVLLHCFVTNYYANDLFDFLFAYYRIDLDRDLSRNNPDMRKYLMQSMSKGENSARAYKIRKHTADAVYANEKGCRIRAGKILRYMDNALFDDLYPTKSRNRIARLFCLWTKESEDFDSARKQAEGLTRNGTKHFSTPYIHYSGSEERFYLVLPPQCVRLDEEEPMPRIFCIVIVRESERCIEIESESCVTGCKTLNKNIEFQNDELFEEIKLELKKGCERIQRFTIKAESARFFDKDWNLLDSNTYAKYLPDGEVFAFAKSGGIVADPDVIISREKKFDYTLYNLALKFGNVLRMPDGKAKSVGKPMEEGLLKQNFVIGAQVVKDGSEYPIYNNPPSVCFRMSPLRENGTRLIINDKSERFNIDKCLRYDIEEETDEKWYILKFEDYTLKNGIFQIVIDIPNSRKRRTFSFAMITNFNFQYDGAPYIFKDGGSITFNENINVRPLDNTIIAPKNRFNFAIRPDIDYLSFLIDAEYEVMELHINLPVFQWKFDEESWNVSRPDEIWHKEFPEKIYIKYPDDEIIFSMQPAISNVMDYTHENEIFFEKFSKDKDKRLFCCDTRKMISWFGHEEAVRVLSIEFPPSPKFDFAEILTRCRVDDVQICADIQKQLLIIKSDISGYSDCVADVFYGDERLAEKKAVKTSGICLEAPLRSGKYRIIYYEYDDDDDFGYPDYKKIYECTRTYENKFDLSGKDLIIQEVEKIKKDDSVFRPKHYELRSPPRIYDVIFSEKPDAYYGTCRMSGQTMRLLIKPFAEASNRALIKAYITFYEEGQYFDFIYDKTNRKLVISEDCSTDKNQSQTRYIFLDSEEYYFNIHIK